VEKLNKMFNLSKKKKRTKLEDIQARSVATREPQLRM
jgi:hypothetical protein